MGFTTINLRQKYSQGSGNILSIQEKVLGAAVSKEDLADSLPGHKNDPSVLISLKRVQL